MKCHCRLCGLDWESKKEGGPKACPGCKSYAWREKAVVAQEESTTVKRPSGSGRVI